jgi:hypothetical protein
VESKDSLSSSIPNVEKLACVESKDSLSSSIPNVETQAEDANLL